MTEPTGRIRESAARNQDDMLVGAGAAPTIRLLGPLSVEHAGGAVLLGGRRQRAVLALLTLEPNHVISVDSLVDRLWSGNPPASSLATLQTYVSHLRRSLAGSGFEIRTQSPGYVLCGDIDAIDVARFDRLLVAARAAMAKGDHDGAVTSARAGLDLWRGEALADFVYEEFAQAEASRLEGERLNALALLFEASLQSGRGDAVVAELEAEVARHPLREDFRAQLMRVLARSGRRAEALRVYQQGRDVFAEELGLDPGVALQELERAILDQDPDVAGPARAPAVHDDGGSVTGGPARKLPLYITSFVGRRDELSTCAGLLDRYRLVTVTGPGGIGKTRLAIELARQLQPTFPDGVFMFDLASLNDPETVALAVANGLGAAVQPDRPMSDTLLRAVGDRRCLVVMDNCEHVLDAIAPLVGSLLRGCPNIRVLATSRERLGMAGEAVWSLPTLGLPDRGDESARDVLSFDAVRLFAERANAAWPAFELGPGTAATVVEVCRQLDGIPLALELAAARLSSLNVEEVGARLSDRLGFLKGADRTAPPRQQTLRGAIEWSYDLLDDAERVVLRRVTVFSGRFDLASATAVCAGGDVDSGRVPDLLSALVEKSLVERAAPVEGASRYRMLESIRQFGAEHLRAAGEEQRSRRSHAQVFAERAHENVAGLHGPETTKYVGRLDADADNLRTALEWLLDEGDADESLTLATQLWLYWRYKDQAGEGIDYLQRALARGGSQPLRVRALVGLARLAILANKPGLVEEACDAGTHLLSPSAEHANRDTSVAGAHLLALRAEMLRQGQKEVRQAVELASRAAGAFGEMGERYWQAHANRVWAQVLWDRGELTDAERLVREALELWRSCGDAEGVAGAQMMLAGMARQHGDEEGALTLYEESVAGFGAIGQRWGHAEAAVSLGSLVLGRGEVERAELLGREALRLFAELAIGRGTGLATDLLARVAHERGDLDGADELCSAALERLRADGYGADVVAAELTAAHVALHRRDLDRAERLLAEATGPVEGFGYRKRRSAALGLLARVRASRHDATAEAAARDGLSLARAEEDRRSEAVALEVLAEVAIGRGDFADTVRLLGEATAVRHTSNARMSRAERVDHDAVLAALQVAASTTETAEVIDLRGAGGSRADAVGAWDGVERRTGERRARGGVPPVGGDERRRLERGRRRIDIVS